MGEIYGHRLNVFHIWQHTAVGRVFFLPSTFSFMVQECAEWAFHCWSAKLLMVRSYSSPLKYTVNGLKQRLISQAAFKPWGYTAVFLSLLLKILCISLFLPFCLVCSDCSLLSKPSFIKSQPCTWLSGQSSKHLSCNGLCLVPCYLCKGSPPKETGESHLGKGNVILQWVWETAPLWVCSMYCFYSLCPKYLPVRQYFNSW